MGLITEKRPRQTDGLKSLLSTASVSLATAPAAHRLRSLETKVRTGRKRFLVQLEKIRGQSRLVTDEMCCFCYDRGYYCSCEGNAAVGGLEVTMQQ